MSVEVVVCHGGGSSVEVALAGVRILLSGRHHAWMHSPWRFVVTYHEIIVLRQGSCVAHSSSSDLITGAKVVNAGS